MSEDVPDGIYVYQPFGSVTHPDRAKTGRLFALGGLPDGVTCEGLTREEADAVKAVLAALAQARRGVGVWRAAKTSDE